MPFWFPLPCPPRPAARKPTAQPARRLPPRPPGEFCPKKDTCTPPAPPPFLFLFFFFRAMVVYSAISRGLGLCVCAFLFFLAFLFAPPSAKERVPPSPGPRLPGPPVHLGGAHRWNASPPAALRLWKLSAPAEAQGGRRFPGAGFDRPARRGEGLARPPQTGAGAGARAGRPGGRGGRLAQRRRRYQRRYTPF